MGRFARPQESMNAMALLRRSTPFFSLLWLAVLVLHMSHRPTSSSGSTSTTKMAPELRGGQGNTEISTVPSSKEPVHLVYASDDPAGVEASIRSALCTASEPLEIHYIGVKPLPSLPNIHFYNLTEVADKYNIAQYTNPFKRKKAFEAGLNTNPANYVRFVIHELLPQASKAMWIDADTILRCDVVPMVRNALLDNDYIIAAVPVDRVPMGVNKKYLALKYPDLKISFNAGVYVVDLNRWRSEKITEKVRDLAAKNRKKSFYKYGSQPPLALTIQDKFEHLPWFWNAKADHLDRRPEARQEACLIHWSGTTKPWDEDGIEKEMWVWCEDDSRSIR